MDTTEYWKTFHDEGTVPNNEVLSAMLLDTVSAIQVLQRMYGNEKSQLMVRALMLDWQALETVAWHRGIREIPRP